MKKCSVSLILKDMQLKSSRNDSMQLPELLKLKTSDHTQCWQPKPFTHWGGNIERYSHLGKRSYYTDLITKVDTHLSYNQKSHSLKEQRTEEPKHVKKREFHKMIHSSFTRKTDFPFPSAHQGSTLIGWERKAGVAATSHVAGCANAHPSIQGRLRQLRLLGDEAQAMRPGLSIGPTAEGRAVCMRHVTRISTVSDEPNCLDSGVGTSLTV